MPGLSSVLVALLILNSQVGERVEWLFTIEQSKCVYQLPSTEETTEKTRMIITNSDSVWVDGILLDRSTYIIEPVSKQIVILSRLPELTVVRVVYRFVDLSTVVSPEKSLSLKPVTTVGTESLKIVARVAADSSISAKNWELSGDKSLGFYIGTDAGLGIEQATRINLNGEIENILIEAELSDQSSSIPPEGTTLELEELDKVVINLKGKSWRGKFGDIDLTAGAGGFGNLQRNVVGGFLAGENGVFSGSVGYARPKGEFGRVVLKGIDGVQGPYILAPDQRSAQIVPGSEAVYLDGQKMIRGWDADYTIDYATGEVVFTNRHIITGRSRIEAEFEYLTFNYERSIVVGEAKIFPAPFQFHFTLFQEGDNPQHPLGIELTDELKHKINELGRDTNRAWVSGGEFVGENHGDYILEDGHYRFVGNNAGNYRVQFTYVGESLGSYIYDDSLVGFRYIGPEHGDYIDSIKIPLPKLQQLAYMHTGYDYQGVAAFIEGAFFRQNINLFASRSGNVDGGGLGYGFNWSRNRFEFQYRHRGKAENFLLPASSDDIDFFYRWGGAMFNELKTSDEIALRVFPFEDGEVGAEWGRLKRLENRYVERYGGKGRIRWFNFNGFQVGDFLHLEAGINPQILWFNLGIRWEQETEHLNRSRTWQTGLKFKPKIPLEIGADFQITDYAVKDTLIKYIGQGQIMQLNYKQEVGQIFQINGIAGYQSRSYLTPDNNWRKYFGSVSGILSPFKEMKLSVDISQTNRQIQLKDELFRYVGPKRGNYRRDSLTGSYISDPDGDYERIIVYRGRFTDVRDLGLALNLNLNGTYPIDGFGYYTHNFNSGDSTQLTADDIYDLQLRWNTLAPALKTVISLQGSKSSDRTMRITGREVRQNRQQLELSSALVPEVEMNFRAEHSNLLRRLHSGELDYEETDLRLELTPVIGSRLRLEPGIYGERKWLFEPLSYPQLGKFYLNCIGVSLTRTFIFNQWLRVKPRGEITYRSADVPYLPFDIQLTQPPGVLPTVNIELEHLWGEIFSLSARYIFSDRPDRPAEHNFAVNLQARF